MKKEIKISINRAEFELNLDKADKVREILRQLYNTDEPNERYITKSLEFLEKEEVNRRFSINDLIVHKDEEEIHFLLKKHRPIFWLLLVLWLLLLIAGTLLFGIFERTRGDDNYCHGPDCDWNIFVPGMRPEDGWGNCRLNCDWNNDGICDWNCDTTGNGECDWNCFEDRKTPDDGWEYCYLNCDQDNNGVCDWNCDTTGNGECDCNCFPEGSYPGNGGECNFNCECEYICEENCDENNPPMTTTRSITTTRRPTGTTRPGGTTTTSIRPEQIVVRYFDERIINISNLLPTGQPNVIGEIVNPQKRFSLENTSNFAVEYQLVLVVEENTFTTNNFMYRVSVSGGGGFSANWVTVPSGTTTIARRVVIPPRTTQTYTFDFMLQGTGQPQNEDQGRTFIGYVRVSLDQ